MRSVRIGIGDDAIMVLPGDIAKTLGIREGQYLRAERLADGSVRLGPYDAHLDKGLRIADEVFVEYAETFEALAKS
jgi:hypothetical protein